MRLILLYIILLLSFPAFGQVYTMQNGSVTTCSGTFYDSGGSANFYQNGESYVFTICPDSPGQFVQLDFTEWSTQPGADIMFIYNGPNTGSPSFNGLGWSGTALTDGPGLVQATSTNASGCLTVEFISNVTAASQGWAATISCFEPCQTIVAQLDSATPAPNVDGYIRVCPDEQITLEGSGVFGLDGTGATYEWVDQNNTVLGTGTSATFSYPDPGVYIVNLNITDTNPSGCMNTNLLNQVIQVSTEPDFTGTAAADTEICFGDSTTIDGAVTPVQFVNDCTPPVSGTTFLPDGSGASYTTCITVDCYDSSQTLTDINQLLSICLNMEHTYLGDLDIIITSPNGQSCNLKTFAAGGGGTFLGGADDISATDPGTGYDYCFSMAATTILVNGNLVVLPESLPAGNASIEPGTYLPEESFASLLGSPLNGQWCIEVIDNLTIDNGYIFYWGMDFDPNLQPPELSFTPAVTSEGWDPDPSITATAGNTITVQPATAGTHCYTYRITDDFGCEYTEQVCIDVYPEIINDPPNNLIICNGGPPPYIYDLTQNDGVVLTSNPSPGDYAVTYYETQADADNETNPIVNPATYSGFDGQIIYVRIEYLSTDCYETSSFSLNVSGLPTIDPVADLETCDDVSNDGVEQFDLTVQDLGILGVQDPSVYTVTYYETAADAAAGTNALVSPYTNIANPQPVFARVEAISDTSCFFSSALPVFDLIVNPQGVANNVPDLEVCDDVSNDGIEAFDLESQTAGALGGQLPADYTVTYHESQADADAGVNALVSPYNNISNPQTIYFRVEENSNPTCFSTNTFELIVNAVTDVVAMTPLEVCDDDTDGFAEFTLTDKDVEALNGQTGVSISYYETQADADAGLNPLASPYMNTSNPQTIYIRLENDTTGCYNTTTLNLVVNPLPVASVPTALEACDDDQDGITAFDLTLKDIEVTGGVPGILVSWHETLADAQNDVNALASPYTNITPVTQTVYGRVYNSSTGCFVTVELVLIVNPLPVVSAVSDFELCDYTNTGDLIESFDLTSKDGETINGQADVLVAYYESLADAQAQTNPLVSPYDNISNPQTIWYTLEHQITGCVNIGSFDLFVNDLPALQAPTPLEVCDDSNPDGITSIDLSEKNDEITASNPSYSVSYYLTQADADSGINPLPIPYTNVSNPQTIYARGEDINTGCYATVSLDLIVEQAPVANV
ncbi:MAG: hypothetical protein HKO67_13750, partial [Flavobacteriaceae bacterium]|nr:hypothetical protein [Flavobacteriaceae bacterium]